MSTQRPQVSSGDREGVAAPGVLVLAGPPRAVHLDPVCINSPRLAQLARLSTRSLFGYVGDPNPQSWRPITPLADIAAMVPSIYNAGAGASGRTLVIMLRPDVMWDTSPPRPVTALDVIRGLKRLANPVQRPAALPYFKQSIRGMAEFCAGYEAAVDPAKASAAELAAYQNEHEIAGVFALDEHSVMVELTRPALDVPHLLALPCAAPAPIEYDAFVPGSPELRSNLRSTGPYRPVQDETGYHIHWEPNPAWQAASDPLRERHLRAIHLHEGSSVADDLRRDLAEGVCDLAHGVTLRQASPSPLAAPRFALEHLTFNARGTASDLEVRRRISDAIDATARQQMASAIVEVEQSVAAHPAVSLIPPHNPEPITEVSDRPCAGGDESLVLTHPSTLAGATLAKSVATTLSSVGFAVRCVADERDVGETPASGAHWDIALSTHLPAWSGTGERVHVEAFVGDQPGAQDAMAKALDAVAEPKQASVHWRDTEALVLAEATVVPLLWRTPIGAPLTSDRVDTLLTLACLGDEVDLAALRLRDTP